MSVALQNKFWSAEHLRSLSKGRVLDKNLSVWQSEALAKFLDLGFPTRKTEDWKYTNVASIAQGSFELAEKNQLPTQIIESNQVTDSYKVIVANGHLVQAEGLSELPAGVIIANLTQVMQESHWQQYLQFDPRYETHFSELNTALITGGLFIYIPKEIVLTKPIHVCYQTLAEKALMSHQRNLFMIEQNSQATVIEEYIGEGGNYFNNVVSHIVLKPNSTLSYFKLQSEAANSSHIANTVFTQERDSSVNTMVLSLGGQLNRENTSFNLLDEGACAHLYGLYVPFANQHIDHHTRVDHAKPHGFSQQVYKGIVGEKGHAVFNGKVMVHQDAQQTAAYQNNQNLLLAPNAEIDTKPELEIYADDVKCSHGATVGQLDDKALFYLRSRGIPVQLARQMLTRAFAEELLTSIALPNIAEYLQRALDLKLAELKKV